MKMKTVHVIAALLMMSCIVGMSEGGRKVQKQLKKLQAKVNGLESEIDSLEKELKKSGRRVKEPASTWLER